MTKKRRKLSTRKHFFICKFDFFIRIAPGMRLLQSTIKMSCSGMISNFRFQCPEVIQQIQMKKSLVSSIEAQIPQYAIQTQQSVPSTFLHLFLQHNHKK